MHLTFSRPLNFFGFDISVALSMVGYSARLVAKNDGLHTSRCPFHNLTGVRSGDAESPIWWEKLFPTFRCLKPAAGYGNSVVRSPSKLPCVVLAEPRRSPENRGPQFTLWNAGGEKNRKVKKVRRSVCTQDNETAQRLLILATLSPLHAPVVCPGPTRCDVCSFSSPCRE